MLCAWALTRPHIRASAHATWVHNPISFSAPPFNTSATRLHSIPIGMIRVISHLIAKIVDWRLIGSFVVPRMDVYVV
eukprot:4421968-Amphidinium_carterae.1